MALVNDPRSPKFRLPAALYDGLVIESGVVRRFVLAAANADVLLTHNLYRVPTLVVALDNGTAFLPRWKRGTALWTSTQLTIQTDVACAAPGCFFLVI